MAHPERGLIFCDNYYCFCREEGVKRYAGKSDPVDVMGHLRHDKDTFKAKH